jgi:phospholipid-binding lipoprotein MlaA
VHDPFEAGNRDVHETNIALDRQLVKPIAATYGTVVPDPVRRGLSNVSDTLGLPGVVLNDILQLQFGDALHNTARFAINATLGLGGLLDAASDGLIEERDTDFGETLHTWGFGEGAFVMLPLYGPSTTRDTVGLLVDIAFDPLGSALTPAASTAKTGLKVASLADTRYRYSDLYESVVYDSADSYTQLRLSYLDKRRFELGTPITQAGGEDAVSPTYDIYEDFYE